MKLLHLSVGNIHVLIFFLLDKFEELLLIEKHNFAYTTGKKNEGGWGKSPTGVGGVGIYWTTCEQERHSAYEAYVIATGPSFSAVYSSTLPNESQLRARIAQEL